MKADTISLSFIIRMMPLSYNDTIQLSLSGLGNPSQRYCQLLEVRRKEPFEVIYNALAAFFLCYVFVGGSFLSDACSVGTLSIRPAVALSVLSMFVFESVSHHGVFVVILGRGDLSCKVPLCNGLCRHL
jgi:hypothetical protein